MKTMALIFTAVAALTCGVLRGQNVVYQQAESIGNVTTGGAIGGGFGVVTSSALGLRSITGSPFSGTEQRHSLQVLGDGTRIERNQTSQLSRDSEGRTRMETTPAEGEGPAMVTIQDPVAGATYILDPVRKTANKLPVPRLAGSMALPVPPPLSPNGAVLDSALGVSSASGVGATRIVTMEDSAGKTTAAPAEESLGAQAINGIMAKGTRTTINISAGQIGNDRAFQVVSERWYSDELQTVVKSSNSDPRFGSTTYELTNVSRSEPDPSLFQVPSDYTVNEGKAFFSTSQTK